MLKINKKKNEKNYPSLYDTFELGDRVKRFYKNKNGNNKEYKGIILAINENEIEIYWDTKEGKYRPKDMQIAFSNCRIIEIFQGNENYSPIKKDI